MFMLIPNISFLFKIHCGKIFRRIWELFKSKRKTALFNVKLLEIKKDNNFFRLKVYGEKCLEQLVKKITSVLESESSSLSDEGEEEEEEGTYGNSTANTSMISLIEHGNEGA